MATGTTLEYLQTTRSPALARLATRWFAVGALLGGAVGGAAGYAATPLLPTSWAAESQIVVQNPGDTALTGASPNTNVSTDAQSAAQILRSPDVAAAASRLLDGRLSPAAVIAQTTIGSTSGSPVVTVDATAGSAELAQQLADAVPQAYLQVQARGYAAQADRTSTLLGQLRDDQVARLADVQKQMNDRVAAVTAGAAGLGPQATASYVQATLAADVPYQSLQNLATSLTQSINATDDALARAGVNASLLEAGVNRIIPAQVPENAARPVVWQDTGIGAALGLLIGLLLVWTMTERRRVVDPTLAAEVLGAPLLGRATRSRRLRKGPFLDLDADTPLGNDLKVLTSSLVTSARRRGIGAVVITSVHRREGKSVLARTISAAGEYIGQPVALVDTGFGRPSTTDVLGLAGCPGLSEVLDGGSLADAVHLVPYAGDRTVPVVPVGVEGWVAEPGRRLGEDRRAAWTAAFGGGSALPAIVDAPSVNDHPLALQLAAAGGLVLIASARTSLADLEVVRTRADVAGVPVLGFVLNEFRPRRRRGSGMPAHRAPAAARPSMSSSSSSSAPMTELLTTDPDVPLIPVPARSRDDVLGSLAEEPGTDRTDVVVDEVSATP